MSADNLMGIRVFCRVVELKSFAAAARHLNMSAAMASKHVMQLERRLRTRLLNRSSRHLSLTETGSLYHAKALPLIEELDEVEASVSGATQNPRGTLRITAPVWFANPSFTRLLARYQLQYPDVQLDLDLSGRIVNLVDEGFDLALRVTNQPSESLIARPLGKVQFRFVAAPDYLSRVGMPRSLTDMAKLSMLYYPLAPIKEFTAHGPFGTETIKLNSVLQCTNESLLHLAALEGMGFAALPDPLIAEDLRTGRLTALLPDYPAMQLPLFGVYANRKYLASKVRTFLDFMIDANSEQKATITRPQFG